ncbi:UNVERIFIED_CONTAM: hypothetical protein K2H54_058789 [Gekko kuhli]
MKRCRSDELQQPEEDSTGAEDVPILATMDAKPGDSAAALLELGASNPNPALHPVTRSKPPDLKLQPHVPSFLPNIFSLCHIYSLLEPRLVVARDRVVDSVLSETLVWHCIILLVLS